jgi:hypothetical protein
MKELVETNQRVNPRRRSWHGCDSQIDRLETAKEAAQWRENVHTRLKQTPHASRLLVDCAATDPRASRWPKTTATFLAKVNRGKGARYETQMSGERISSLSTSSTPREA